MANSPFYHCDIKNYKNKAKKYADSRPSQMCLSVSHVFILKEKRREEKKST